MEKILLVGLGNPGNEFERTRHNVGIMAVRRWVEKIDAESKKAWVIKSAWQAEVAEVVWKDKKIVAIFPLTFMNDSGKAVKQIRDYYDVPIERLVGVHDDMETLLGEVVTVMSGSAKGHNGIRSLVQELGTDLFCRIKIGIGRPENGIAPKDFVLARFTEDIQPILEEASREITKTLEQLN